MSKLINVADDVYSVLTKLKGEMSYSGMIRTLLERKTNKERILSFKGIEGVDEEKIKALRKDWKKWSENYV